MIPKWEYEGLLISEIPDTEAVGFVYEITYKDPKTGQVSKYIGKKNFYSVRNVKKGKRELAAMTDMRGSKKKQVIKESNWLKYQSSHEDLKKAEPFYLEKKILVLCYSKSELTYQETKHLFVNEVLEKDEYLNSNILGKFYKAT